MTFLSLNDVYHICCQQMAKYNLFDYGWSFEFDNAKKRLGCCRYYNKTISLSKYYIEMNLERGNDILDTILHEIAHALDFIRNGRSSHHGRNWQRICIEIGANPIVGYKKDLNLPKGKFSYVCPNCGKVSNFHKKIKRDYACGKCCNEHSFGKFDSKYRLVPSENNPY